MMFDIFLKLSKREKNLILIALIAVVFFVIFLISKNIIDSYTLSKQKLTKAKSDYEYVVSKVVSLNQSIGNKAFNVGTLNSFLQDTKYDVLYKAQIIKDKDKDKDKVKIKFQTNNLEDSLLISKEILNEFNLSIENFSYSVVDDKSQTILSLNY